VSETRTLSGRDYTVHYGYDALDRIREITYPSGMQVHYTYDAAGRVVAVQRIEDGSQALLAGDIAYTGAGQLRALTLGNGHSEQRRYDRDGRVLEITVPGVLARAYFHDASGNILAIDDARTPAASQLFGYDALERLTHAAGAYGQLDYGYDPVGNRASQASTAGVDHYSYDPASNRLLAIDGPNAQSFGYDAMGNTTSRGVREDAYDDAGRLQASTLAGVEQVRYRYNALGERVQRNASDGETTYVFGHDGQLLAEADGEGRITREHVYLNGAPLALIVRSTQAAPAAPSGVYRATDGIWNEQADFEVLFDANVSGLSVRKNGAVLFQMSLGVPAPRKHDRYSVSYRLPHGGRAIVNVVLYPPGALRPEPGVRDRSRGRPASVSLTLRHGPDPAQSERYRGMFLTFLPHSASSDPVPSSAVYYHHLDHLGTPQALTDEAGTIAWQAHYLPFGQTVETIADIDQPIRFPGQFVDAAAGAVYNYQRWYAPGTGRYLRSDPIGLEGGINTYAYVGSNPLSYTDPHGLNPAVGCAAGAWAGPLGCGVGAGIGTAIMGGMALAAILSTPGDATKPEQCTDNSCPPCTPYATGTIGYIGPHTDHDHFPIGRPHLNLFQVNQNPKNCKCFWNKATPDAAAPPPQPGWVNLNGGFPPLSP
jgi:RHS repeat-associated protein